MSIDPTGLRTAIEAQIVASGDTCRVSHQGGTRTHDTTGTEVWSESPTKLYEGGCLIDEMSARAKTLAGFDAELEVYAVSLPYTAIGITKGDAFTMTKSRDATLSASEFQVASTSGAGSLAPQRVLTVVRVAPAGRTAAD